MEQKTRSKFLGIFFMLAIAIGLLPGISLTAFADTINYDLWVGGVRVTSDNADNIDGESKASYNVETKTLTLNGYSYEGEGYRNFSSANVVFLCR